MNLHILNDEKFFDPFVEQLEALGLLANNVFVIKEDGPLNFVRRKDLVYARMRDEALIGDVSKYDKVFIHCFTLEMYAWVHRYQFKELNWMIWGKELYKSEFLYEEQTKNLVKKVRDIKLTLDFYFLKAKNFFMNIDSSKVYGKIDNVLTWIQPEYEYAVQHIKGLRAKHQDFAYTFEYDVEFISSKFCSKKFDKAKGSKKLRCILGNSGVASNNHLDAIHKIKEIDLAEILIPISYGNKNYIKLLRKELSRKYLNKNITYLDTYMTFGEYVDFYCQYDVFINNSIRPVGMGNIWMALLMGKLVFMNPENLVFPYLRSLGFQIFDINDLSDIDEIRGKVDLISNRNNALSFLSKSKINEIYISLFSNNVLVF